MRSFALALAALPALASASVSSVAYAPAEGAGLPNGALQNILKNTDKTDKYRYPTDFTRGIEPVRLSLRQDFFWGLRKSTRGKRRSGLTLYTQKPFHSHNDYWRDVPFYSGLAAGAVSTEADVWLIDGILYVGSFCAWVWEWKGHVHGRVMAS